MNYLSVLAHHYPHIPWPPNVAVHPRHPQYIVSIDHIERPIGGAADAEADLRGFAQPIAIVPESRRRTPAERRAIAERLAAGWNAIAPAVASPETGPGRETSGAAATEPMPRDFEDHFGEALDLTRKAVEEQAPDSWADSARELLNDLGAFLEGQVDVRDGEDGRPLPNRAMSLSTRIAELLNV